MKLEIPLIAAPYQKTTVVLNGQRCRISVKQMIDGVFLSLWVNNQAVKMGVICQNNVYLIKNNAFVGDLHFEDYQGFENPDYSEIGSRFKLIYSDTTEALPLPVRNTEIIDFTIADQTLLIDSSNDYLLSLFDIAVKTPPSIALEMIGFTVNGSTGTDGMSLSDDANHIISFGTDGIFSMSASTLTGGLDGVFEFLYTARVVGTTTYHICKFTLTMTGW